MSLSYHHSPLPPIPNEYYAQQPVPPFQYHHHQYPPDPSYFSPSVSQNQQQQQQQLSIPYPYPNINNKRLPQGFSQPSQIYPRDPLKQQSPLQSNPPTFHPYSNPISQFNTPNPYLYLPQSIQGSQAQQTQYFPQLYSDSKKPELQETFQRNNGRLNPITWSRTKRSYSDNNDNVIINKNQNFEISQEKQTYQVSVKDQLGRALAEQIEAKKRKEAAEKEENKRQELNFLNFNLNNSPYTKNNTRFSPENNIKRTYEQSPQHLPKIMATFIPRNQRDTPQILQQFKEKIKQENHQDSWREYENNQYELQIQQPLIRQVTGSKDVNAMQDKEKYNKNQKLLEYQQFLQQQIQERNVKKQQEKERKIQEDLRFQKEFEQQRVEQILREQEQKQINKELGGRRGRKRIISMNATSNQNIQLQKQEKSIKIDDNEEKQFEKQPENISRESISKEQIVSERSVILNNQDDILRGQIENNDNVEVVDETMVNMINVLNDNQLRMQNILNQIKQSSEESKQQNQIQFDQIQQMLLQSHKNNSNIDNNSFSEIE